MEKNMIGEVPCNYCGRYYGHAPRCTTPLLFTGVSERIMYHDFKQIYSKELYEAEKEIDKLKAENKHLAEIFNEAMKSASEYSERLCKANKENEMMREGLEFYDQALRLHWAIDLKRLSEVANEILKKIDENKKETK